MAQADLAFYKSACSVAATYKPPMLVPRVRLPAGALQTVGNAVFWLEGTADCQVASQAGHTCMGLLWPCCFRV